MKKTVTAALLTAVLLLAMTLPALAAPYGAATVEQNRTYTLKEMLTIALEDEYLAYARYDDVIRKFGAMQPFSNILMAETIHIASLKPLLLKYNVPAPENDARNYLAEPAALADAYKAGIAGETANIAMYDAFLKQELPPDVRVVFTGLQNASERHLAAFKRGLSRLPSAPSSASAAPAP